MYDLVYQFEEEEMYVYLAYFFNFPSYFFDCFFHSCQTNFQTVPHSTEQTLQL